MSRAQDAIERLLAIMERLRGPDGCPWDREQTLRTPPPLRPRGDLRGARGHRRRRSRASTARSSATCSSRSSSRRSSRRRRARFDFADVADAISDKLVSRHPHVFGNADAKDAEAVLRQWAALKREEKKAKGGGESVLEGVPREMPALARADRLTEKASRIGFDWPDAAAPARSSTRSSASSTRRSQAGDRDAHRARARRRPLRRWRTSSRKLGVPPEEALRGTVARFVSRFGHVERELARRGVPHGQATLAEMDALWDEAKSLERQAKTGAVPRAPGRAPPWGKTVDNSVGTPFRRRHFQPDPPVRGDLQRRVFASSYGHLSAKSPPRNPRGGVNCPAAAIGVLRRWITPHRPPALGRAGMRPRRARFAPGLEPQGRTRRARQSRLAVGRATHLRAVPRRRRAGRDRAVGPRATARRGAG